MPKLTKRTVDALARPPEGKDLYVWDSEVRGFGFRLKPNGTGAWIFQYRKGGKSRRMTFGTYPGNEAMTPEQARARAEVLRGGVREGDPARERKGNAQITVAELCDEYLTAAKAGLVLGKGKRPKSATTIATDEGRIKRHIKPLLGTMAVADVQDVDVQGFLRGIQTGKTKARVKTRPRGVARVTGGAGTAARTVGLLGGIFSYAIKSGHRKKLAGNPVQGIERTADGRRTRFLSTEEYQQLGTALAEAELEGENPLALAQIRLLALTGCRRGEVVGLKWPETDLQFRELRLAGTKEGFSLRPLGRPAVGVLEGLDRHPKSTSVFAVGEKGRPYQGLPKAWLRVADRAGLKDVTLHTLRHSFATVANMLKYSEATIAELLGHSRGTVTSLYIHHVDAVILAAADRVSTVISRAMAGEQPASITRLVRSPKRPA